MTVTAAEGTTAMTIVGNCECDRPAGECVKGDLKHCPALDEEPEFDCECIEAEEDILTGRVECFACGRVWYR